MIELLTLLVFCHFLADYPFQGDFLAKAKNRHAPLPGVPWYHAMVAHASIHGGFVALCTGSLLLGLLETVSHFVIDDLKCSGKLSYSQDQAAHFLCKVVWVSAVFLL